MDADTRLAKVGRLFAAYEQSHSHPHAFACCSAHAVADEMPGLVAELTEATIKLEIAERQNRDLDTRLAERDEQIAGLLHSAVTDDEPAGVP